ncbi:monocarboxylate transporter 10 isoform X2 [Diachasmimorpha longicaudata]|uniref:monocarboxylate transporter 10 isoform X2 n=1 Tax=Diachasmimorpha longicaudata TaxID=58733 RepID=UPI0030B8B8DC
MTATEYTDSNGIVGTNVGSADTRCVIDNQRATEEMMTRVKVTPIERQSSDNGDESEAFIDNNHPQIVSLSGQSKSGNLSPNKLPRKKAQPEDEDDDDDKLPPDGGVRAWMIMLGSFTINGILFSVINSYSLIFLKLSEILRDAGETEVSSKASLVGSLTIGTTFFLSPVAGILTDKIGIQMTTFIGGALAFGGMLLSSMFSTRVEILYLTYGVMYGLGASLAYTPSLVILGHYFKRYLGLVNGVVTAGSSVFTTIMPYLMGSLLKRFGLVGTLRSLAVLTSVVMMCAILFKPIPANKAAHTPESGVPRKATFRSKMKTVVNTSIWKRKKYVVWASAIPLALFGYFVPYVHIANFVQKVFDQNANERLPIMCIGITSGIGRLVFGYIADLPRINRILLQQISFLSIGVLTMLLPLTPPYYSILLVITLIMGLFDGCFISLLGPIAFDICGREGATQAIGFLLGMCSIPLTVGPPIAGLLFDHTGSYTLPLVLAGIPPIIGAGAMFLVWFVDDSESESGKNHLTEESINDDACLNGIAKPRCELLDGSGRGREEGRSSKNQNLSAAALCNAKFQRNLDRACYSEPFMDCPVTYYRCSNEIQRNGCGCITYSESVPLLISTKLIE